MNWEQLITALFAGTIFYELIFKHPENVGNAIDIAKNPAIPPAQKLPKYWHDKKMIDAVKERPISFGDNKTKFYNPGDYPNYPSYQKEVAWPKYVAGLDESDV